MTRQPIQPPKAEGSSPRPKSPPLPPPTFVRTCEVAWQLLEEENSKIAAERDELLAACGEIVSALNKASVSADSIADQHSLFVAIGELHRLVDNAKKRKS